MSVTPSPPFEVSRVWEERASTLLLRGELDMYSSPQLARELDVAEQEHPAMIVLDLSELSFMDVTGLRAILDAARRARREHRRLVIANPLPHIVRLLELTAIDQSLEVSGRPLARIN
jgi:anti-sigma B factor antagonist